MTTHKQVRSTEEALKLALEALIYARCDYSGLKAPVEKMDKAITAVEKALAQPEQEPLTDEQMLKIWLTVPAETEDRFAFARAIEAAHGIKE